MAKGLLLPESGSLIGGSKAPDHELMDGAFGLGLIPRWDCYRGMVPRWKVA